MTATRRRPPVAVAKDHVADEVKALKDTVAQLRAHHEIAERQSRRAEDQRDDANTAANHAEQQDRRDARSHREGAGRAEKAAGRAGRAGDDRLDPSAEAAAAHAVPMVLGDPPTTLKPPILQDYVLRRVYDGAALIEGRNGIIEVEPGIVAPGLGRIEAIKRQDGRWVVVTARGLIVQR